MRQEKYLFYVWEKIGYLNTLFSQGEENIYIHFFLHLWIVQRARWTVYLGSFDKWTGKLDNKPLAWHAFKFDTYWSMSN